MKTGRWLLCLSVVISFFLITTSCTGPPSDASAGEYHSPGGTYAYLTYGTGTPQSPYSSEMIGLSGASEHVVVPPALEGYPLTTISDGAFSECPDMTSVVIPSTVTSIGKSAFDGCGSLTEMYFLGDMPSMDGCVPQGTDVKHLQGAEGWGADTSVLALRTHESTDCTFSYYVINGAATVFSHISGNKAVIPGHLDCDGADIPVVSVGAMAFMGTRIVSAVISEGVSEVGVRAFYKCGSLTAVTLPRSLRILNDESFRECIELGDVELNATEYIGFEAFRMCRSFTHATVPDTVQFLGDGCFYYCTSMTTIELGAGIHMLPSRCFTASAVTALCIPENITEIGDSAFYKSASLKHLSMASVQRIGDSAFYGCGALERASFGNSLKSIGESSFEDCVSIADVSFPATLDSIGGDAFRGCRSLSSATIGGGMPSVGEDAFRGVSDGFVIVMTDNGQSTIIVGSIAMAALTVLLIVICIHVRKHQSYE